MKKFSILAMIALSLTGCGSIPGLSMFGSQDTTTTSSAQQSFYSIMGVDGTDASATDTASGSVGQPGANLAQLLFDLLDTNGDGTIAAEEFSAAVLARRPTATDSQISQLFAQLDQNKDSAITVDELQPKRGDKGGKGGRGGREGHGRGGHREHMGPPPAGQAPADAPADAPALDQATTTQP